ncbi:tripartite tricarboxylate transporter substrate-binding protein [Cupriavidus sp. D39]|nr:tripartite tricarboxylate transporter substrate-binding protein [Cupriavidus sp. D39]
MMAAARPKPRTRDLDSAGSGSSTQLSGELFKLDASGDIGHIPRQGIGEPQTDVMAGLNCD